MFPTLLSHCQALNLSATYPICLRHSATIPVWCFLQVHQLVFSYHLLNHVARDMPIVLLLVLPSSSITSARSRGSFQPKCSNQSLLNIWNCFKKSLVDSHTSLFFFLNLHVSLLDSIFNFVKFTSRHCLSSFYNAGSSKQRFRSL